MHVNISFTIPTPLALLRQWRWSLLAALVLAFTLAGGASPAAAAGGNSITAPDTAGSIGQYSSLALDAGGNPVVSYHDATNLDLKVMHCNDANCAGGGESITAPDTAGSIGQYSSLALDAGGNPVVSYRDSNNQDLKVMHCNDANCAGGDESITSPDTTSSVVGEYTSLALDGAGNPVVSYYDTTNSDLKLLHCNDANCAGGGESITSPDTLGNVGKFTSLSLDGVGNPVVSYCVLLLSICDGLRVLHCNDANCAPGSDSINQPDIVGNVGGETSIALDAAGNPVVSYYDATNGDLKVMHCNDANCAGNLDESITAPDTGGDVGQYTSLVLDAMGSPVVSYFDLTNGDLKLLYCNDANCSSSIDITSVSQVALPKTCFEVHDAAQTPLFGICDNDFQVGFPESDSACVPDGVCDDEDSAQGAITVTVASANYRVVETQAAPQHAAPPGKQTCDATVTRCSVTFINTPNTRPWHPWDITGVGGLPDGLVRIDDILAVVTHYFQDKPLP